ncbi:MAG: hypothetical protein ACE5RP_00115 [Nitrosopumilus sp.]
MAKKKKIYIVDPRIIKNIILKGARLEPQSKISREEGLTKSQMQTIRRHLKEMNDTDVYKLLREAVEELRK